MRVWLIRGAMALAGLLLLVVLSVWLLLRGSLAMLEGQRHLPGLTAPVSIQRDANGTVTIDAENESDALRALGFVHAQERFFEMDLMRRSAAGELSALVGRLALNVDKAHRQHRLRARVERDIALITGHKRAQLDAYVEGVNAGLAQLPVQPWAYFLLRKKPQPWRVEDTPLTAFAMYFDLQGGENKNELALWRLQPHVPPALYALLTQRGTQWDAALQGAAYGDASLPSADLLNLRALPSDASTAANPESNDVKGSNNFAVAGNLTRDGRAIVADDMHLGLRAPSTWFRARLRYSDPAAANGKVDVQGFTLPGLPLVVVGSNQHIAWGFTNSYIDTMDWKLETLCDTQHTQDCSPVQRHQERIEVAHAASETITVEETAWGPVLQRDADGKALSLRWVAHLPAAVNLGLTQLAQASDLESALVVAKDIAMPTQNLIIGDNKGQIAWRLVGPIPQRAVSCQHSDSVETMREACPTWAFSTQDNPLLRSPQLDRMWTANGRVVDDDWLARVGDGGYTLGARGAQIRDALHAQQQFNEHDLLAIQLDDRALLLQPWQQHLQATAAQAKTPHLQALAAAAAQWEGHASVDSVSYRIVHAWRLAVHKRIADGLTAPARVALGDAFIMPDLPQLEGVVWPLINQQPAHLLPRAFDSWAALFEDAATDVQNKLEATGPLAQRTWGERNTAAICHPLANAIPWVGKRWLCMPAQPLAGDAHMPRVAGPAFGASQRMVVAAGHEADGIIQMPGGQSGHPLSPFWGAGHADWVAGKPSPFLPGEPRYRMMLLPSNQ